MKTELYAINSTNLLLDRIHRDKMNSLRENQGRHGPMKLFITTEEADHLEQFARIGIGEVIKERARREVCP